MSNQLLAPFRPDPRNIVEHRFCHLFRPQAAVERDGETVDLVLHPLQQIERARARVQFDDAATLPEQELARPVSVVFFKRTDR